MPDKTRRQERVRELLTRNQVRSQEQLLALLRAEGIESTQATLSRDLRELGVSKSSDGYVLPDADAAGRAEVKALERALRESLVAVTRAGTLVVLRTRAGLGPSLALRIEAASPPQAVGVIASGDTLFVAAPSWSQADELVRRFRRAARL